MNGLLQVPNALLQALGWLLQFFLMHKFLTFVVLVSAVLVLGFVLIIADAARQRRDPRPRRKH